MKSRQIFLFLFIACQIETIPNTEIIEVNPTNIEKIRYSDFVKDFEFIKLKSDGDVFFGNIDKIIQYENDFYILDSQQALTLYVFEKNGDLKYKIDKNGRGPGELTSPYDFDIDEKKQELVIFDGSGQKLVFYDLKDGSFNSEIGIGLDLEKVKVFDDRFFFLMNNTVNPYRARVVIANRDFKIVDTFLQIEPGLLNYNVELPRNFSVFNDTLFLTLPSDYNIYALQKGYNFREKFTINPGSYELPEQYFKSGMSLMERYNHSQKSIEFISNFFRTDSYTFFTYRYGQSNGYIFLNSDDEKSIHTNNFNVEDDIGLGPISILPSTFHSGTLIWYQESAVLLEHLEQMEKILKGDELEEFKKKNERLIEFSKDLSIGDNPYLILTEIQL